VEKSGSLLLNYSLYSKKTLFILVTDTQSRLIAALVIDERQKVKNPPNELLLYSVHRNHVE
jgi:hypothetical protein